MPKRDKEELLLIEVLPELAQILKRKFLETQRMDLYKQVEELRKICLCECGETDCGSFYTLDPELTNVAENEVAGFSWQGGLVEVYKDQIGFIEILPSELGKRIRNTLVKALNLS